MSLNYCTLNGFEYSLNGSSASFCQGYSNYSASIFQSGIYKILVKVNGVEKTYFYYDNRHSQFPSNNCSLPGFLGNDICVRYDVLNNKLYYKFGLTSNPDMNGFDSLKKSEVINWWELGTTFGYDVSGYQTRFFAVLNTPVSINNAPYLSWQAPNVSDPVLHYKIQRSWYPNDFHTIATTSSTSYHDLDIFWNPNSTNNNQFVQYRIVTVFQNVSFPYEFSNTQKLFVNKGLQKDGIDNISELSFSLDQNYPNPFNPVTKIKYHLPTEGFVFLKVYNTLGEEVAILVNQYQQIGSYEKEFDGGNLPSGIYLYKLDLDQYSLTKKMIIIK